MSVKSLLLNFLKFAAFLSVGLIILYFVYQGQNEAYMAECATRNIPEASCSLLQKVLSDFASVRYGWLLVVLLCFTLSNVSRAIRWNMLLREMGYQPKLINAFLTVILGYFANLGLPRAGEVVRAAAMGRYEEIPVEKVMGTVVADRIIDVISILVLSALAMVLAFGHLWGFLSAESNFMEKLSAALPILIAVGVIGLAGLWWLYKQRRRWAHLPVYQKIAKIVAGFVEGIRSVTKVKKPWWFVFHSVNIWFMYFMMTYTCFFSFAPTEHLSAAAALVVFVFGGWGIVIPSPGGMGTYHFLATTALTFYGVSGDDGFSWSNISFFSIQLGCNVLIGLLSLVVLPIINKKV